LVINVTDGSYSHEIDEITEGLKTQKNEMAGSRFVVRDY
jgi:hypothetical protein